METRYYEEELSETLTNTLPHSPPTLSPGSDSLILSKKLSRITKHQETKTS